jgi:transposase, IS6 family
VDHISLYRWVQHFTPLVVDAARTRRHTVGDRSFVDETYVKVRGVWRYVYRADDQHGQVIDVYVSRRRDIGAERTFFTAILGANGEPEEVVTDLARALRYVIEELFPGAIHNTDRYANNRVECDHGRLKARLLPMRGLKTDPTGKVIIRAHAFMQNLRRGHYDLGVNARNRYLRVAAAFDEIAHTI